MAVGRAGRWLAHRLETTVVAVVALAVSLLYLWAARYHIDMVDEGYFMDLAYRVYGGGLPYRDFDTYYTPGIFYLLAATFEFAGVNVLPVRVLMVVVRVACGVLLYALARRVAPPRFAVIPVLLLAGVDAVPAVWSPHPGWWALAATLLSFEFIVRHHKCRSRHWLLLAGAAVGLAFLFKQNVGTFAGLALLAYLLLRPETSVGWFVRLGQVVFVVALSLVTRAFLRPALDVAVAATVWLPVVAALNLLLWIAWRGTRPASWTAGLRPVLVDGAVASAGGLAITLTWFVPLVLALGIAGTPLGLFVGDVKQGALTFGLLPLPLASRDLVLAAVCVPCAVAVLLGAVRGTGAYRRTGVTAVFACTTLVAFPTPAASDATTLHLNLVGPALERHAWASHLQLALGSLFLYLPAIAAWLAIVVVGVRTALKLAVPLLLPWITLAGSLSGLAFYPRFDAAHAAWAGAPLFAAGAAAAWYIHQALTPSAGLVGRTAVYLTLWIVPIATVAPHVGWRFLTATHSDLRTNEATVYVPLDLERAPVLVPERTSFSIRGAVEYLRERTAPGEPVFAYPVDSMLNFLADRPNPTRFNHLMPGALTEQDMEDVVFTLDATRPTYVIWDHGAVVYWNTDWPNRRLSDYIWRCYRQEVTFDVLLVMRREGC
jgi:hypothetical protein